MADAVLIPCHVARLALAVSIVVGASACRPPAGPGASSEARATGLALTAAALLTGTPPTPVPPSDTPAPTPIPTETPTLPPPTSTATEPAPPPSDTPAPEATPCENRSAFVTDVTVPDRTHFAPGTAFVKTWRLRNSGDCGWTTAYQLRHIEGSAMGAQAVNLPAPVPPGATIDISVSLTAPGANGTHIGRFQLFTPDGEAFGTRPYVEIIVP